MDLSTLAVAQLNAMTKAQLVTALTEDRRDTKTTVSTGDKRGQLREVQETRGINGNLVSSQEVLWTYYPKGNVDTITVVGKDTGGKVVDRKVIKHPVDGQPFIVSDTEGTTITYK